jgi:dolichol-phosphate mannosyltransferase
MNMLAMRADDRQNFGQIPGNSKNSRTAIIMPVYNEADTIESTIREICAKVMSRLDFVVVWVFEDGSKDGTKKILSKLSEKYPNLHIRMSPTKKGYPRAMREAFLSINPKEYSYVIAIDSDGQYEPNDFFRLFQTMGKNNVNIVMGRRISRREPPYRLLLSKALQIIEKLMFPIDCKDVTSVMRIMRVEMAHRIVREIAYSPYNFWLEFSARVALKGYSIIEIPINYRERLGGSKVYSVSKMPKIVFAEMNALIAVKKEYKERFSNKRKAPNSFEDQVALKAR